jgi:NlpC/P60 family putative phage cell wall peptidase
VEEAIGRAAAVVQARSWVGTPYHHAAQVKGAGVDCARILDATFVDAGLIERFEPAPYPPDWHAHRDEERYVETILRFAKEFDWRANEPRPADVLVWKYGRTFSHGGIVTLSQPLSVVHAYALSGCVEECQVEGTPMASREMRAFSLWPR